MNPEQALSLLKLIADLYGIVNSSSPVQPQVPPLDDITEKRKSNG